LEGNGGGGGGGGGTAFTLFFTALELGKGVTTIEEALHLVDGEEYFLCDNKLTSQFLDADPVLDLAFVQDRDLNSLSLDGFEKYEQKQVTRYNRRGILNRINNGIHILNTLK